METLIEPFRIVTKTGILISSGNGPCPKSEIILISDEFKYIKL